MNIVFFDLEKNACHVLSGPIFGHAFVYDDESHTLEQLCGEVFVVGFWQTSFFGVSTPQVHEQFMQAEECNEATPSQQ